MLIRKKSLILKIILMMFMFVLFSCINAKAAYTSNTPDTTTGATPVNPNDNSVDVYTANQYIDALIKSKDVYNNQNSNKYSTDSPWFYANSDTSGKSDITEINVKNDIDLTKSTYGRYKDNRLNGTNSHDFYWTYIQHKAGDLTVNGEGHTIDYGLNNTGLRQGNQNWTLKDMKIYGQSYWGPLSINEKNTTFTYDDVSYYGSQLVHSMNSGSKINIKNKVYVHSVPYYYSFDNNKNYTETTGGLQNQQNMQVGDIEFHEGSRYIGETYAGNVLELNGGMNIDKDAKVELHPHNFDATENGVDGGNSVGIKFLANSYLNAKKDSNLNIFCNSNPISTNNDDKIEKPNSNPQNRVSKAIDSVAWGSSSVIKFFDGASVNVDVDGYVKYNNAKNSQSSDPAISLNNASFNIGSGSSFNINSNVNKNLEGYSDNGILNLSSGKMNIDKGGSFNINSGLKNSQNQNNYLIYIGSSTNINLLNPKSVFLNDQDQVNELNKHNYQSRSNSKLIANRSSSFINATDVSLDTVGSDSYGNDISIKDSLPFHKLLFPINGSDEIDRNYVRILGDYFSTKELASSINKTNGQQYAMMHFTQMPTPYMTLSNTSADDNTGEISGNVKDQNGNNLKNAYVKIYIDNTQGKTKNYYYNVVDNPSSDIIDSLIKQNQILYNQNKQDFPADNSTNYKSGNNFSNNTLKADDFNSDLFSNNETFNEKLDSTFNSNSKKYSNADPYIALTDENGNFKFTIPDKAWKQIGDGKSTLHTFSTYNFVDSQDYPITLNQNLQVDIDSTMKNVTKEQNDGTTTLDDVDQGDSQNKGDTLQFDSKLKNSSKHYDYNDLVYEQPVPNSIDLSTLQMKQSDGSYKNLDSSDYEVDDKNDYKVIKLKNIGELNHQSEKTVSLRGTLKNNDSENTSSYNPITFKTKISDSNNSVEGPDMTIKFAKPRKDLSYVPEDLYYSDNNPNKSGLILSSIYNKKLGVKVTDERKNKTPVSLSVHQNSSTFSSNGNGTGDNTFQGELFYYNGSNMTSLLNHDVTVATSDSNNQLQDVYWNKNNQILLKLTDNINFQGDYQNGNKNNENPGLSWTATYGP